MDRGHGCPRTQLAWGTLWLKGADMPPGLRTQCPLAAAQQDEQRALSTEGTRPQWDLPLLRGGWAVRARQEVCVSLPACLCRCEDRYCCCPTADCNSQPRPRPGTAHGQGGRVPRVGAREPVRDPRGSVIVTIDDQRTGLARLLLMPLNIFTSNAVPSTHDPGRLSWGH